jgi:hypothetical protein
MLLPTNKYKNSQSKDCSTRRACRDLPSPRTVHEKCRGLISPVSTPKVPISVVPKHLPSKIHSPNGHLGPVQADKEFSPQSFLVKVTNTDWNETVQILMYGRDWPDKNQLTFAIKAVSSTNSREH